MKQFKSTKSIVSETETWLIWFDLIYTKLDTNFSIAGDISRQFGTCPISSRPFTTSPPLSQIKQIHDYNRLERKAAATIS